MSTATLTPNKIHSLPVLVRYHLPHSSQSFTTLFSSTQSVYVHPSTGGEDEDGWGSIYLKTVVQGVLMASPELHPHHPSTIDLSLYILDPRETYLRKSRRATPFQSTPAVPPEIWTGKGLVSWALEEPGEGKNLITGRLVRSDVFNSISGSLNGISPLEALAMTNGEDVWGIEISLGLRSGNSPMFSTSTPVQSSTSSSLPMATSSSARSHVSTQVPVESKLGHSRRSSVISDISSSVKRVESSPITMSSGFQQSSYPSNPRSNPLPYRAPSQPSTLSTQAHPLSPSRIVSTTPHTKARDAVQSRQRASTTKKRGVKRPTNQPQRKVSRHGSNYPLGSSSGSSDDEPFPDDIIAQLYKDPGSLTKEQAERLMASPAFLSRLSKLTGQPILVNQNSNSNGDKAKKRSSDVDMTSDSNKKARTGAKDGEDVAVKKEEESAPVSKCWNCGRTKSAVWRMKDMGDGNTVRVCNACGLYWNKMRAMRPPKLWEGVDADVKTTKRKDEDDKPASRVDAPTPGSAPGSSPAGFKRTMSSVVNEDAKRIAALRRPVAPPIGSGLKQSHKPSALPMTSPARPSSTLPSVTHLDHPSGSRAGVRNAKWTGNNIGTIAASSPGGYSEPMHPPAPPSDNFQPVPPTPKRQVRGMVTIPEDSPNTAIRKILGADTAMQSLDMPLSEDGNGLSGDNATAFDWSNADFSAFFDVEGFSMDNSNVSMGLETDRLNSEKTEGEDDALSQLFNRTSSVMLESSPSHFDFSQLPPSSPPVVGSDLPHSALLLSSPDLSPMDRKLSPLKRGYGQTPSSGRPTPIGSVISNPAPTPANSTPGVENNKAADHDKELKAFLATHQFDVNALEELWRMTSGQSGKVNQNQVQNTGHQSSSVTAVDGMLGQGQDFFAMLEKGFPV